MEKLLHTLSLICFFLAWGTIGACDKSALSLEQTIIQLIIFISLMVILWVVGNKIKLKEWRIEQ